MLPGGSHDKQPMPTFQHLIDESRWHVTQSKNFGEKRDS
jgi:hypothetical protein